MPTVAEPIAPVIASRGTTALGRHLIFAARMDLEDAGVRPTAENVVRYCIRIGIPVDIALSLAAMIEDAADYPCAA